MSFELNGTDDFGELSYGLEITTTPFWFSIWFKPEAFSSFITILSLCDPDTNNGQLFRLGFFLNSGRIRGTVQINLGTHDDATVPNDELATIGQWHHAYVLFLSGGGIEIVLDDQTVATDSGTITLNGQQSVVAFGRLSDSSPSQYFQGHLAEFAMGDTALTTTEITALAAGECPINVIDSANLKHYFKFLQYPEDLQGGGITEITSSTGYDLFDLPDHPPTDWPDETDVVVPMGRWTAVPRQLLRYGEKDTLGVGCTAFSVDGIEKVTFDIDAPGGGDDYSVDVTEPSLNPDSNVYEYWTELNIADFSTTGDLDIDVTITANNGGIRDRNTNLIGSSAIHKHGCFTLTVRVDPNSTDPPIVQAYVDPTNGDDSSGSVNDSLLPFLTLEAAIDAIAAENDSNGHGDTVDNGELLLEPGSYSWSDNAGGRTLYTHDDTWFTAKPAPGILQSQVVIDSAPPGGTNFLRITLMKFQEITFSGAGVFDFDETLGVFPLPHLWFDDCHFIGELGVPGAGPPTGQNLNVMDSENLTYTYIAVTDCVVEQNADGWANKSGGLERIQLVRGGTIRQITEDAFRQMPNVINIIIQDMDPGPEATWIHPDVVSTDEHAAWENLIFYGVRATGLGYSGILTLSADSPGGTAQCYGFCMVNCYMANVPTGTPTSLLGTSRSIEHFLVLNCTLHAENDASPHPDKVDWSCAFYFKEHKGGTPSIITNGWVIGCTIRHLVFRDLDSITVTDVAFRDNHIHDLTEKSIGWSVTNSTGYGFQCTTGNPTLDASGIPTQGSPLINRFDRLVNIDAAGNERPDYPDSADVGAFETVDPVLGGPLVGRHQLLGATMVSREVIN